jgi:diketogulonate reductase-like aldo/keto reductase
LSLFTQQPFKIFETDFFQGMEELVHKGLCKAIGVSNLTSTKIAALLETAEIVPATNQGEDLIWINKR